MGEASALLGYATDATVRAGEAGACVAVLTPAMLSLAVETHSMSLAEDLVKDEKVADPSLPQAPDDQCPCPLVSSRKEARPLPLEHLNPPR